MRIPLFPLHTVLFPGQVLPLHIFEARYRQMIAECLQQSGPFGVVLIKKGTEAGQAAEPMMVGTTARITHVQTLDDGRLNILTVGDTRFRVLQLHMERPYLEATTSLWQWPDQDSADLHPLAQDVLERLRRYLTERGQETNQEAFADVRDNPVLVATAAAAVPDLSLADRQRLLEMPTLRDLLRRETDLLEQERQVLRALRASDAPPASGDDVPYSKN
jgi:Lon protease-like protein